MDLSEHQRKLTETGSPGGESINYVTVCWVTLSGTTPWYPGAGSTSLNHFFPKNSFENVALTEFDRLSAGGGVRRLNADKTGESVYTINKYNNAWGIFGDIHYIMYTAAYYDQALPWLSTLPV